jgi:hypothetical protein
VTYTLPHCTAAPGALDLALLLEATELQCLVPPTPDGVRKDAMLALQQTVEAAPRSVRAEFAATSGEALLSIAEHLVEDVLLVSSGAAGAASGSAAGPPAASRGAAAVAAAGTDNQPSSNSNSNSSSSSKRRYLVGGGSPEVTLMHRVRWAQDSVTNVGVLMRRQRMDWAAPSETGGPPELGGEHANPSWTSQPAAAATEEGKSMSAASHSMTQQQQHVLYHQGTVVHLCRHVVCCVPLLAVWCKSQPELQSNCICHLLLAPSRKEVQRKALSACTHWAACCMCDLLQPLPACMGLSCCCAVSMLTLPACPCTCATSPLW